MEDKERANMVLKRIGEMPYFDAEAIINVLVNEFAQVRKEAAQQSAHADGAYWCCPKCNSFVSVKFDICGLCKSPRW